MKKLQYTSLTLVIFINILLSACTAQSPATLVPTTIPTIEDTPTSSPTSVPSETSTPTETPLPTNTPEPFVRIIDPADEGKLNCDNPKDQSFCLFTVDGESGGIGSYLDLRIYVFVFPVEPPGAGWYLQLPPAAVESNGNWIQSPSYLGSDGAPATTGDTLRIRAVLVTREATLDDELFEDLIKSKKVNVLNAIEDIEGIIAISDITDVAVAR